MRTVFDKLSDAYAKYYSSTEHLAVDEVIVIFKGVGLFSNSIYQRNTSGLG
jgi:hypothetical protein